MISQTKSMMKILLTLCVFCFHAQVFAVTMGGNAPDFTLKSNNGENLKLSEHQGNVVMINFWATWCGPCRQEMPALEQLYQKYKDLGFVVLGVNIDEVSSNTKDFLAKRPVSFPVLFDNKKQVSDLYKVVAMPTTYILDRDGRLRYYHRSYKPGYELKYAEQIKTLIRE